MLKNILDDEPEINDTSSNESLDLLLKENYEIQGETLPTLHEEEPKTEELDQTTATALKLRYRLFNGEDGIRMVQDEKKEVWFVADDVCKILGYKNTKAAIVAHCSKVTDSKDIVEGETELCKKITVKDANGHGQAMIAINEPDLYRLIMRSRMPDARKFEKWVVEDVLPTIRKTGKYTVRRKIDYMPAADATTVASAEGSAQCELFPNMMPSMTFPKPLTEKINAAKQSLFEHGTTFPSNRDFLKFLVQKGLDNLES